MLFFKWLAGRGKDTQKPSENQEFEQLAKVWSLSAREEPSETPDPAVEWARLEQRIKSPSLGYRSVRTGGLRLRSRLIVAVGAVVVLTLSSTLVYDIGFTRSYYTTQRGERLEITLPDGSRAVLNGDSHLTFQERLLGDVRKLTLTGEAYFDVVKAGSPFKVSTYVGIVTVLGTVFNVKSRDDYMEVVVKEGLVGVNTAVGNRDSTVFLSGGQITSFHKGEFPVAAQNMPLKEYPGWLSGKLSFYQSSLKEVLSQVAHLFETEIVLVDKSIETVAITGLFETGSIRELLDAICKLIQKEFKYENGRYVIY